MLIISIVWALGTFLTIPIKALQSLLQKMQDTRDVCESEIQEVARTSQDRILGASGPASGLITVPIQYSPAGNGEFVETRPLVYVLPAPRQLYCSPLSERCAQILLLIIFNQADPDIKTSAEDIAVRSAGDSRAVSFTNRAENIIRDLFCNMADERDNADIDIMDGHKPFTEESYVLYNFKKLSLHLARELVTSETASLLVYCLLQYNSTFLHSLMSSKGKWDYYYSLQYHTR